jgi:manganese/iron transport system substrate-binding protein
MRIIITLLNSPYSLLVITYISSNTMFNFSLFYRRTAQSLLVAGALAGCTQTSPSIDTASKSPAASSVATNESASSKKPLVVATTSVLCDLTKEIAQDTIDLKCLVGAGADPHTYQPTPADRQAIDQAKLILYGGYNFEPSIIKLVQASSNAAPKIAINEVAVTTPLSMEEDGKKETDPHVWHNAQNGIKIISAIQSNLAKIMPAQADSYRQNAQALTTQIGQIDTWIKAQIATIPSKSRKLVTTHDALGYYANAYKIPVEGALQGFSTEEKPTPVRIKKLVDEIKKTGVPTIFGETTASSKILEQVAKEANVKISLQPLFADGLGEPSSGGETYQKMLLANTKAVVEGLGGKFQPFQTK